MPSPPFDLAYHGGKLDLSYEATPPQTKPTSDEQLYAISLYHSYIQLHGPVTSNDAKSVTASSKASGPVEISGPALVHRQNSALTTRARTPRFRLIKDIQNRVFSDLVVQVVKMFLCHDGTVEFYVTDYTENGLLHHYKSPEEWGNQPLDGDPYGYQNLALKKQWVGPFGKHVLQVKLWGSNAAWAKSNVKEEGFVFLRNVTIKTSMDSRLEAALHEDRKYPGRVDLETLQLSDPDVIQVLRRKQEYTTKRKSHNSGTDNPRLSKAARKRKRKSEKKEMVHQKVPVDRNRPPNMPSKAVTSSNSNGVYL